MGSTDSIRNIRWIYGTLLSVLGAAGIFVCGTKEGSFLFLSASLICVTSCLLLDEDTKGRIIAFAALILTSFVPLLLTKQWWSAAFFTVPATLAGRPGLKLRLGLTAAAMGGAAFYSVFVNDYGRVRNLVFPLILLACFAFWASASVFAGKYIKTKENMNKILKISSIDSMSERQLREELAKRNKLGEKNARLEERERISRDIHNSVGHTLSAASVTLDAAQILVDSDTKKAGEKMDQANSRVHEAIDSIRGVVRTLDSEDDTVLIKDYITSLKEMVSEFAMDTDIKIRHNLDNIEDEGKIDISTAALLSGAVKEFLTNGVKHGKATIFVLMLTLGTTEILLKVQDNGTGWGDIGYEEKKIKIDNGFGIRKLRDHAKSLGGNLDIDGSDGFSVTLDLPRTYKNPEEQ